MLNRIFQTRASLVPTILRLAVGLMILPHGMQKVFGSFGGPGFQGEIEFLTQSMHIPWVFALLAIAAEFLGGLGLILGLFTRIAAFGVGVTMLVAALTVHLENGFFMNWFGNQKGEGIEFFLLVVPITVVLMIEGAGRFSFDCALERAFDVER